MPGQCKRSFKAVEELLEDGLFLDRQLQPCLLEKLSRRLQSSGRRWLGPRGLPKSADDQPQPFGGLRFEVRIILRSRSSRSELFCDLGEVDFEIVNQDGLHEHPTSTIHSD